MDRKTLARWMVFGPPRQVGRSDRQRTGARHGPCSDLSRHPPAPSSLQPDRKIQVMDGKSRQKRGSRAADAGRETSQQRSFPLHALRDKWAAREAGSEPVVSLVLDKPPGSR